MKRRGVLSKREYDRLGHDDVDAIADTLRRRALEVRDHSREGLLRSVAHVAGFDDEAFGSIVIDPAFLDSFTLPSARAIVDAAVPELQRWLADPDLGKAQRARYALIRFLGADSPLVNEGLSGSTADQTAVIYALTDPLSRDDDPDQRNAEPLFQTLPASLLPALMPLLAPKALKRRLKDTDSWTDFGRLVAVLVRIASDDVSAVLLEALDVEELRSAVVSHLLSSNRRAPLAAVSPAIRTRFERAMSAIEASRKAGLPNRIEVALAGALAAIVGRDRELARLTLRSFDLLPVGKSAPAVEALRPLVALLEASVDLLEPRERATLAAFMTRDPVERLPAAAAAWVRLPASEAKSLADKFKTGERALEESRWQAAARAYWSFADRSPDIAALIPVAALGATAHDAPRELAIPIFRTLIGGARNPAELLLGIEGASAHRDHGSISMILAKLRDTPYRIDANIEALLGPMIGPDEIELVRQEIDGDNPFRDRREALERVLASRG